MMAINSNQTKPAPNVKLPGEVNPEWSKSVTEYLSRFKKYYVKHTSDRQELYDWCRKHMGKQYLDWSVFDAGTKHKTWCVIIRNPKHGMLFELMWADLIIETFDRVNDSSTK